MSGGKAESTVDAPAIVTEPYPRVKMTFWYTVPVLPARSARNAASKPHHPHRILESFMSSESLDSWQKLDSETLGTNPYWSYRRDRFRTAGGNTGIYYYVQTPGSVLVVPLMDEKTVLMVRQYRYLRDCESLELPGGGRKIGQSTLAGAQNELREETGFRAALWQEVGGFNPCKGLTDEWCTVFVCRQLQSDPLEGEDPFEVTAAVPVAVADIPSRVADGEIWCGMTIAAWFLAARTLTD